MSLILRISHSSGMKRIDADLNDNIAIFQKKIESITGVNPQNQMLSTTSMGNPNFVDLENKSALLKDFNFKNGKILYLISDGQNISKMAKNESLFERSDKCQHDLKTRCPYCKAKKEVEIKKKCFHGDKGFCLNCSPLVNSKKKIRNKCYHKEDTFCNNCIPERKLTKNEERQILKEQNCFCSNSKQRCIYCSLANKKISDYADSKHISSYSKFLADKRDNCNHQKSSFDTKTKFCAMCKPEKIISYKIKQCKNHAPWPKGICSQCTPPTAVIKLQNYRHCDEVSVMDTRPLQKFISSWLNNPEIRKVCFLIGSYSKIETGDSSFLTRAEIQAIYLPPHVSSMNSVTFKKDPNFESVKKIAESAKLQIIGWAFTSIPRSDKKYGGEMFLSAAEIRQASKFQSSFCDNLDHSQFITMVISHNEEGQIEPKCYQVSDQCVALERENIIIEADDPGFMTLPTFGKDKYAPNVIYKTSQVSAGDKFLPDEFLVKLGSMQPEKPKRFFERCEFPLENVALQDIQSFVSRTIELPYHKKFSDFNAALWIRSLIGIEATIKLMRCVAANESVTNQVGEALDTNLAKYFGY